MSDLLLVALAMLGAGGVVALLAWLLVRGAAQDERVTDAWIGSHIRDRRDEP